ncbi:MAG TPA: hypothetical protein DD789_07285 [Firmicutes bacterium]|nr:hypothetical protein [Bacillota bacterium]
MASIPTVSTSDEIVDNCGLILKPLLEPIYLLTDFLSTGLWIMWNTTQNQFHSPSSPVDKSVESVENRENGKSLGLDGLE